MNMTKRGFIYRALLAAVGALACIPFGARRAMGRLHEGAVVHEYRHSVPAGWRAVAVDSSRAAFLSNAAASGRRDQAPLVWGTSRSVASASPTCGVGPDENRILPFGRGVSLWT